MTDWNAGDLALLPVVIESQTGGEVYVRRPNGSHLWASCNELIPDDRKPGWLPGQPGDVAE